MTTAIFVGSFDPFTIGHDDIVRRALPIFDHIYIGIGINKRKQCLYSAEERLRRIKKLFEGNDKITVMSYNVLTVDFAKKVGANYIIKGVRSMKDFEYEREQADINRKLSGIETIFFYSDPRYSSVSSSTVRELIHYGHPVDEFLPTPKAL